MGRIEEPDVNHNRMFPMLGASSAPIASIYIHSSYAAGAVQASFTFASNEMDTTEYSDMGQ